MKIAVIDLGTNTFHLLIAEKQNGIFKYIHRERIFVKIGQGGINDGIITEAAFKRALKAIQSFKKVITKFGVEDIRATATSAIRNARNGMLLLEEMQSQTGILPVTITGEQEAELIYIGVKNTMSMSKTPSLIMDIGGGSVEFIIANAQHTYWKQSFEIGAQRLHDIFHIHEPISPKDIDNLFDYLQKHLAPLQKAITSYQPLALIGTAGTFDTLKTLHQAHYPTLKQVSTYKIPCKDYQFIHKALIQKNREERLNMKGMLKDRVDMIVVASCIVHYVLSISSMQEILISIAALKEGLLYQAPKPHQ